MPEKAVHTSPKIKELNQRLESNPRSRVFMELAKEHQAAGELSEAVTVCLKGLEAHPRYHSARVLLGKLLLLMERFEEAIPELQKVTAEAPENVLARRLLGEALAGAGHRDEALACFHELLRLHPEDPEAQGRLEELTRGSEEGGQTAGLPEETLQGEPGVETLEVTPDPGEAEEPDWEEMPAAEASEIYVPPTAALHPSELEKVEAQEPDAWEEPAPEAEPAPVPEPEPEPEPEPAPEPEAAPEAEPEPVPEPAPALEAEPEPALEPAPEPAPGGEHAALPTPTLAELYEEQGMPEKAAEVCEKILEGDPDNSDVRERLLRLRGGAPAGTAAARLKIRALESWLERLRRVHDAQSRP
jgi:tetratricopeptide (TPR) repeat protein